MLNTTTTCDIGNMIGEYEFSKLPHLPVGKYQFNFQALESVQLPEYAGSAWRGLFGHGLKRTVCVTRERRCENCLLHRSCIYPYIFETPPPLNTTRMRRYPAAPHPFIIYPQTHEQRLFETGESFSVQLSLFGRATAHLPYIVHTFQLIGSRGIGRGHGRFQLNEVQQQLRFDENSWQSIWQEHGHLTAHEAFIPEPPDCPSKVVLEFISPMRLKRDGQLVGPEDFEFHDLFRNLLRRISSLMYFHAETPLEVEFAELTQASRQVHLQEKILAWRDWTRYSSRQQTTMQMGGLKGRIALEGTHIAPFWPFLWLGQWTHAGKGTSMGLGKHRIIDPASLPDPTITSK